MPGAAGGAVRVCITIRSLTDGGAEKQSILLARALQGAHEVDFVATSARPCREKHVRALRGLGIEPVLLPDGIGKLAALTRRLRERRTDVVLSHLPGDTFLAALAARRAGVERVFGGLRNAALAEWKWPVLRWLHRHYLTAIVANSEAARGAAIERGFDPDRLIVIPNGIDVTSPPRDRPPGQVVRIVGVGRFVAQKDFETSLCAFARLRDRTSTPCELELVGTGPLQPTLERRIEELRLGDCARLVIDPADMDAVYADADVYLSTSLFEGLSNAALEAMAASLPLVVTDVGDQARLVAPGGNGYVIVPGDAAGTADALLRLIEDAGARTRMGQESRRRVEETYAFPRFQQRALDLVAGAA
jgi:glycosyltransferase involved in cell wall biosynthesis